MFKFRHIFAFVVVSAVAVGAAVEEFRSTPTARVQTEPVPTDGDAADDPAIWIHPSDPTKSLLLGTDKKDGLHVYSLDGRDRQLISPGSRPNNVDVIYGFTLNGKKIDLALASVGKDGKASGVKVWTIDADGKLAELSDGPTFKTFGGGDPYGLCIYHSPRNGAFYVFVTDRDGAVEQYRLEDGKTLQASRVREFRVGSQAEGIVADRERGKLFVAEENVGIWEYGAEPEDGNNRKNVARVGEHGLVADVEGLAIYYAPGGKGYLLASSQENSTVVVYDRSNHSYVLTIDPSAGTVGDVAHTDGLDVTNERTSAQFPRGFLVMQDGENPGRQNFKLFAWEDVAAGKLIVDTTATAR